MIENKEILIIGGTGSLGKALTKKLIRCHNPKGIRIYSRDEFKQWEMKKEMSNIDYWMGNDNIGVSFLIGDVRDKERLHRAMNGVDYVINCAAMKQVPACEYNPIEAVKTNINGAMNIIDCAIDNKVERVMHISTDKAVYPINLYGATKAVAEKLFIHANVYTGGHNTIFSCCRYGNVLNSRGSIIPMFNEQAKNGYINITHQDMTRFFITLNQVSDFIINNILEMKGKEIFVPYMPSMKIVDFVKALWPNIEQRIIGMRQGEKLHEVLITEEESLYTESLSRNGKYYYRIGIMDFPRRELGFMYNSFDNEWMSDEELRSLIIEEDNFHEWIPDKNN